MTKTPTSIRLPPALLARLKAASNGPYAPTMNKIIERGIELALEELGKRNVPAGRLAGGSSRKT